MKKHGHIVGFVLVACFGCPVFGQNGGVRTLDFNDFSYRVGPPYCDYFGSTVTVHRGRFANNKGMFEVSQVLYGDLTGSGDQAVVVTSCAPRVQADSGWKDDLVYVYGLADGRPNLLATFAWGEPWDFAGSATGPRRQDKLVLFDVTGVSIEANSIVFDRTAGSAHCCPNYRVTQSFRWGGGLFALAHERKTPWTNP